MTGYKLRSAFLFLLAIVALATGKPPPPPDAPWAKFISKPAYARSLGPPPISGMGSVAVPFIPKPSLFPKFVDPRMMIAKKTDMLANLFGGFGPAMGPPFGYYSTAYMNPAGMYGPDDMAPHGYPFSYPTSDETEDKTSPGTSDSGSGKEVTPEMIKYLESIGAFSKDTSSDLRRGLFGPPGPKASFGGSFGPTGPKASFDGSFGPKTGPFYASGDFSDSNTKLFKIADSVADPTASGSSTTAEEPLPPNPKSHLIQEKEAETVKDNETQGSSLEKISSTAEDAKSSKDLTKRMIPADGPPPAQYFPGMYGSMGPMYGPPGAAYGPGAFMGKKSMFLDTLFKNLATTTPAPTVTEVPIPKSTIVPPEFWMPGTVIPEPGAYDAKVAAFLDKLFDSLKLNVSKPSVGDGDETSGGLTRSLSPYYTGLGGSSSSSDESAMKSVRALEDPLAVIEAKDQIMSAIIEELGVLKDDMVSTFNDLVAYQKNASMPSPGSKPFKPFGPPFWGAPSTSVELGTLPYKQRMVILDQVFDMLSELHTNISTAVSDAVKSSYAEEAEIASTPKPAVGTLNISVLDTIQKKLMELKSIGKTKLKSKRSAVNISRSLPGSPTSFWVAYPGEDSVKRNAFGEDEASRHYQQIGEGNAEEGIEDPFSTEKDMRAIKMQMHQGYQSLPPGTVESIQAGGGSVPGHEGGGVKLLGAQDYQDYKKWRDWSKDTETEWQNNRHRHHHDRH